MVALAAVEAVTDAPESHVERLRRDAIAVCSEYFTVAKAKRHEKHPPCPGCEVRELENRDLVAEFTLGWLCARRREARVARETSRRALAAQCQAELPI